MAAALSNLDPSEIPSSPAALEAKARLIPEVYETLIRLDAEGNPQPWLATSWTHDAARKRWVFTARPNVHLQDDTIWTPAAASLEVSDDRPIERILRDLARPWNAIVVRGADGSLLGTGPFRITKWESGQTATLVAFAGYWHGRPFLDSIEIQMNCDPRDQAQDMRLGKADCVDAPAGTRNGPADTIVALVFESTRATAEIREAISLAIDRVAIRRVLLKDKGEISGALLPQWLSGYAFLFDNKRDAARAHQLGAGAAPLNLAYDRQDAVLRPIAERISVNAMEVGITMRPGPGSADVRLVALPVTSPDGFAALADMAVLLKVPLASSGWSAADRYQAERTMVDGAHVLPLFQLTRSWNVAPGVHNWPDLVDVWIGQR